MRLECELCVIFAGRLLFFSLVTFAGTGGSLVCTKGISLSLIYSRYVAITASSLFTKGKYLT